MIQERGTKIDHATLNRWVIKYAPILERSSHAYKKSVGSSWRMDETYIKVKGQWVYYYRAVDKENKTIDFYLSSTRDTEAAQAFFQKAFANSGVPTIVNIDKSGANLAGLNEINKILSDSKKIKVRQVKYLNNGIEQDHRAIKRLTKPMMGFKHFVSAAATLAGIELYHMIRKGQFLFDHSTVTAWKQFYQMAA